jgi:hypothetical protein
VRQRDNVNRTADKFDFKKRWNSFIGNSSITPLTLRQILVKKNAVNSHSRFAAAFGGVG